MTTITVRLNAEVAIWFGLWI